MVLSPFVLCRTMDGISGCSHLSVETLAQSSFYLHETLGQVAPVPEGRYPEGKYQSWARVKCVFTEHLVGTFCYNYVLQTASKEGEWKPCVKET